MKKKILAVALSTLMVCTLTAALYACGDGNTDTYTVTYAMSAAGETGTLPTDENKYKEGDEVTLKSADLTLTNYHFMGWNDGSKTYKVSEKYTMPARDVTLTAVWQLNGYTVTYINRMGDGTTVELDDQYQTGDEITLLGKDDFKDANGNDIFTDENGRVFSGWYTYWIDNSTEEPVTNYTYYHAGDKVTIANQNVTLYAYWQATSVKVEYYDAIDGNLYADKTQTYEIKEQMTVTLPTEPTKKDFEFIGWFRCDDESKEFTELSTFGEQDKEYGALSVFAKWKEKSSGEGEEKTYSVIYSSDYLSGYTLDAQEYKAGETVTVIGKPEALEGYGEFLGWFSIENGQEVRYEVGETFEMPAKSLNLFPLWEEDGVESFTVYFYLDEDASWDWNAEPLDEIRVDVEEDGSFTVTLPDVKTFELGKYADGYEFVGWFVFTSLDGVDSDEYEFTETLKPCADALAEGLYVYAKWTPVTDSE